MKEKEFILEHRNDDVRQLALMGKRYPDIDMTFALNQIAGWQTARTKLPSWAEHNDIVYPPHISMEQCSSEQTALYKASLAKGKTMVDLTGGFGVDFSFLARNFEHSTYVEKQEHLCKIAEQNFKVLFSGERRGKREELKGKSEELGVKSGEINVVCADSVEYLRTMNHVDLIYIDPARRDEHGAKTYAIEDCTPNIIELQDLLFSNADTIIIKLSPMLDWHSAIEKLHHVKEVHIISVDNECKEMVLVVNENENENENGNDNENENENENGNDNENENENKVVCVNIMRKATTVDVFDSRDIPLLTINSSLLTNKTLFVPNASIMKSGLFGQLCHQYGIASIGRNSNLFIADDNNKKSLPGKCYKIIAQSTMNKRELKATLADITHANIAVRNFPLSVDQLRKRLKLKDGGNTYIFGTTDNEGNHVLLICESEKRREKSEKFCIHNS